MVGKIAYTKKCAPDKRREERYGDVNVRRVKILDVGSWDSWVSCTDMSIDASDSLGSRRRFISCGRRGRTWRELFVTADPAPEEEPSAEAEARDGAEFFRGARQHVEDAPSAGTKLKAWSSSLDDEAFERWRR